MKEVCSCGAAFEYDRVGHNMPDERVELIWKMMTEWRTSHKHDFPPSVETLEAAEPPLIHESGSSHERDLDTWMPEEVRTQIGFRPNH